MNYTKTTPCDACPFLKKLRKSFTAKRLEEFASGSFVCHKTGVVDDDYDGIDDGESAGYRERPDGTSQHCVGALIYLEKRNRPSQMMRIAERLRLYDRTKLNMEAEVR